MTGHRFIAILVLSLCCLTGCSVVMQSSKLPDGFALREIAKTDRKSPFDVSRNGKIATVFDGNLQIVDRNGTIRTVEKVNPTALRFSPDGERLAAVLTVEKKHFLRLFDAAGNALGEAPVPEPITCIAWRGDRELLATGLTIRKYSFGSGLTSHLYAWDGSGPPTVTQLESTTIRPQVAKLPDETLLSTLIMAVAPYQDEIAYTALKDPPLFTPYLRVVVRHLDTGKGHDVLQTSVGSGGLLYEPDAEHLVVGDSGALTRRIVIADGKEINAWPTAGNDAAISPSGDYLFLDGRLFKDNQEVAWFPSKARGLFRPDGSAVVIAYETRLFELTGLDDKAKPSAPNRERMLKLRRLRAEGLISEKEYQAEKAKVTVK